MYLCLNKLASKVWSKNCPKESWGSFIKQVYFEKIYLQVAGFLQSSTLYYTITHDPREYDWQKKVSLASLNGARGGWGVGGREGSGDVLRPQQDFRKLVLIIFRI